MKYRFSWTGRALRSTYANELSSDQNIAPSSTADSIVLKLSSTRMTSAASLDTSVPLFPIDTPISAIFRAGASLTVSRTELAIKMDVLHDVSEGATHPHHPSLPQRRHAPERPLQWPSCAVESFAQICSRFRLAPLTEFCSSGRYPFLSNNSGSGSSDFPLTIPAFRQWRGLSAPHLQ